MFFKSGVFVDNCCIFGIILNSVVEANGLFYLRYPSLPIFN